MLPFMTDWYKWIFYCCDGFSASSRLHLDRRRFNIVNSFIERVFVVSAQNSIRLFLSLWLCPKCDIGSGKSPQVLYCMRSGE